MRLRDRRYTLAASMGLRDEAPATGPRTTQKRFEWTLSDEALEELVDLIPNPPGTDRDTWIAVLHGIMGAGGGFETWDKWSAKWDGYDAADTRRAWDTMVGTGVRSGGGLLRQMAEKVDPGGFGAWKMKHEAAVVFADEAAAAEEEDDEIEALQRDVANLIVRTYGDQIRFNVSTSLWHRFEGVWKESPYPLGYRLAKRWADANAGMLGKAPRAAVSKSAFYEGVEKILRSDEKLAVEKKDFDRDSWLLGTPGGTVDLRTGVLRVAVAGEMISLSASVTPTEGEDCPQWLKFIDWACSDPVSGKVDKGMRTMLKQWAGYCLTGDVSKEMVLFFHGGGANGKGTFVETVQAVMGSYFYMATKDLFMEGKFGAHTEEIAALAGKRMVAADEVPTSSRWNESLLKSVSGGGMLTSRHLYGRVFSFPISFKVTIIGNEKPTFQGTINEALKRRLHMVEFRMTAKPIDPDLKKALALEAPGVLRWMLSGLQELKKEPGGKLFIADSAIAATEEYFNENDLFGAWIGECVVGVAGAEVPAADALRSWTSFRNQAAGGSQSINTSMAFKDEMVKRMYVWKKTKTANVIKDIQLKNSASVF